MGSQSKTICIVSSYYPPHVGGVEAFTQNLALELERQNCKVVILTCNVSQAPGEESISESIRILRLPTRDIAGRFPLPLRNRSRKAILASIASMPIDAFIVNQRFYPLCRIGAKLAQSKGLRPVVIEHGSDYLTLSNVAIDAIIRVYEKAITKKLMKYRPLFFGVSAQAAQSLKSRFGIEPSGVIHNAIDAQAFRDKVSDRDFRQELGISDSTAVVVFSGRLIKEKGVWDLMRAGSMFQGADAPHFVMAGDGPELEELKKQAPKNVHMMGKLSHEDLAALLMQADAFCFPSRYPEGLPTSLLEAAACGAYIISADVGGAREVVPSDEYGTVLKDPTSAAIHDAIESALLNRETMRARAMACREHVEENLSWKQTARASLAACFEGKEARS